MKQGVLEWFSCGLSFFFSYPCSFGNTVIGAFGCERGTVVSILIPILSFEWWSRYQFRLFLLGSIFQFYYILLLPFSPIQFPFLGFSQRYLRRWYIRRLLQDEITGAGTVSGSETEKIVHFFFTRGSGCWGWSLFIMCILAYGTVLLSHSSIAVSWVVFVLWCFCFVCFGIYDLFFAFFYSFVKLGSSDLFIDWFMIIDWEEDWIYWWVWGEVSLQGCVIPG